MVDKPSWIKRAEDLFGSRGDQDDKELEKSLHKLGLDVLKDQKLEHRVKLLMQFHDMINAPIKTTSLTEYIKELKDREDLINEAIYEISAPFARSLDFPQIGKAFHGWGRLNASAKSWILRSDDIIRKAEEKNGNKKELVKETESKQLSKPKEKAKTELEVPTQTKELDLPKINEFFGLVDAETIDVKMLVNFLHDVLSKHIWKDGFLILGKCFMDRDISPRSATVIQNANAMREREDMTKTPDF
jgi:hypothetical protein